MPVIERAICEAVFREAVVACDPAARVREALAREPLRGRKLIGFAVGKAAMAMARGAGPVARGLVVTIADAPPDHPAGWSVVAGSHPFPDETSIAAAQRAIDLVDSAQPDDVVLALISGGASSLLEQPIEGVTLDEYRECVREKMASGASIYELNTLRTKLSAIKGGKLAARSAAPIVTLVVSDVIGDDPRVIGSGPTVRDGDRVEIIAPMASFGDAITKALGARGIAAQRIAEPIANDVAMVAQQLVTALGDRVLVAWGEPTVRLPERAGEGGRAQQLALELAKRVRGTNRSAFVAGSDGIDRSAAAGAYVDGSTWDAIGAAEAERALAGFDSGSVLRRVGALVVTGPTGINHADIVIAG